jgi:hypothetical protein
MNKIRTPRGPRNADRTGLCHVSIVIQRLLAMYGITDVESSIPLSAPVSPPAPVTPSQQTFPWFSTVETHA